MTDFFLQQIRVDTGRSAKGSFVRVVDLLTGKSLMKDPIGSVPSSGTVAELTTRLCELVATELERGLATVQWGPDWQPVVDGAGLVAELGLELGPRHRLSGQPLRAVARRAEQDDVLYAVGDPATALALVHLTWSGAPEPDAAFPATVIYASVEAMLEDQA